jgi:3-oxoacyl-(acyl-carrier-protein) synthase
MRRVAVVAVGAVSPLGRGAAAFDPGLPHEPARSAVARDEELAAAGSKKPFAARVALSSSEPHRRAEELLRIATRELTAELDRVLPGWRTLRLGVCIGTSGGGMPCLVRSLDALESGQPIPVELARGAPYFGPLRAFRDELGVEPALLAAPLAACASSTFALGIATRWLELERVELVIAGGYDALSSFIAAGFECLGATSESPAPFRVTRSGLALGEGAALLALVPADRAGAAALGEIHGFGAASDAVHVTAPDRTGAGLARAARTALADADLSPCAIGLVSAHGTGTSYNDSAESRAIAAVLGEAATRAVVQPFKGVVGHTLGAAGALESLAALAALDRGLAPAAFGTGEREPELTARLLDRAEPFAARHALKLSAAFGGANAALVLSRADAPGADAPRCVARRVGVLAVGTPVTLARPEDLFGVATDPQKLARMDPVSLLAVRAAMGVSGELACGAETAVVVGTSAATLEIDFDFEERRRRRGPEPRRFPATSPNLSAGECSIAFRLLGPALGTGASGAAPLEALLVAHDLVAAGDAERALVVAVDWVSDRVRALFLAAGLTPPAHGAVALVLGGVEGPGMSAAALGEALGAARLAGGGFGGAEPGWPSLLRALATL